MVKCSSPPILKYIAFDHEEVKVYKGEGSVNLVAFYPYGIATKLVSIENSMNHKILNPGDLPTGLKIYYSIENATQLSQIKLLKGNEVLYQLNFSDITSLNENDKYICIDTSNHLIEGLDINFKKTGNLYNRFIESGDFFSLPVGVYNISSNVQFLKVQFSAIYY